MSCWQRGDQSTLSSVWRRVSPRTTEQGLHCGSPNFTDFEDKLCSTGTSPRRTRCERLPRHDRSRSNRERTHSYAAPTRQQRHSSASDLTAIVDVLDIMSLRVSLRLLDDALLTAFIERRFVDAANL